MQPLGAEQLAALHAIDTPTICNAIETLNVRGLTEGYLGLDIRCQFPELGVMVGYAVTCLVDASSSPAAVGVAGRAKWVDGMDASPKPGVLVFHDVGPEPRRSAHFGEGMATVSHRLGMTGLVCDGGVRDVNEVRAIGFHYFAPGFVASHGTTCTVDGGMPVQIDGVTIHPGDLIHADINGVAVIPYEIAGQVADAARRIIDHEAATLAYLRGPEFTLAAYKRRLGIGSP